MYVPAAFRVEDSGKLTEFIRRYSFATFVTKDEAGAPFASHLPMLFRAETGGTGRLLSHVARANPQWRHFADGTEALAVFHGPHTYISPTWYAVQPAVPTWNYAAVHVYGRPVIIEEPARVAELLRELVATYEAGREKPWTGELPAEYQEKMMRGIVAFEIEVTRMEGKFKLGQNRAEGDVRGVYEALARSEDAEDRAVARLMEAEGYGTK